MSTIVRKPHKKLTPAHSIQIGQMSAPIFELRCGILKRVLDAPPKMLRPRILVFIKDEGMARRLSDTAIRFGVTEADIVENIVRKHIPEAPFQYKPKRRMRFTA